MKQVKRLKEVLSPPPGASSYTRMAGRFGHQMVGDTTAFAHNLPHRLLLWDCLDRLPEILDRLLDNKGLRELIRDSALRADNVDEIADPSHRAQLETTIREDLKRIWSLSSVQRRSFVEMSAKLLCEIADEAWSATETDRATDPIDRLWSLYADGAFPARWFFVLQEALPHLEREIWLTETSAPLPAHALMRMHDNWALFVLLWCYVSRDSLRNAPKTESSEVELRNAFFTTVLKVAVIGEWSALAQKPDSDACQHEVKLVVGPIFVLNNGAVHAPDQVKPHLRCARQFLQYMRISAAVIPEWSSWAGAVSSLEELMDAYDSRFPVASLTDLKVRCNGVRQAWLRVHEVELAWPNHDLTRDDWEFCAAICAWLARWEDVLNPILLSSGHQLVGLPRWERNAIRIAAEPGRPIAVSMVNTTTEPTIGWLDHIKAHEPDFDLPLVLWNRLRERQTTAWSAAIGAMNNLMQRRSTRPGRFRKAGQSPLEASHLLHGFGDRLCRYIVNIGQSDQASVYWVDYEENPPRLKLVASYSRAIRARSQRLKVHEEFDAHAYRKEVPDASCNARGSAISLAYRCAAANRAEVWSDGAIGSDKPGILAAGHSDLQVPRSAMAVPLRANGRVIGVLELAGSSRGQFGKQLRAPLRRVASLVGPVLYQNLLLWQLGRINMWTASLSPYAMEVHHNNRLSELSSLLCNVFACPLVHIWLRTSNVRLFELDGSSRTGLLEAGASRGDSPYFTIDDVAFETVGPNVPFEVAALALWNVPRPPRGKSGSTPARRTPAWGNLVKAMYDEGRETTHGDLESALSSEIRLGRDFMDASESYAHVRDWIVNEQGLNEMAAFAIVREIADSNETRNGDFEVIGVVALHDYGDANGASVLDSGSKPLLRQSTFGVAWLPIVAFMQEHLANVLPQVRLLADPIEQVRQVLLHEARHEVRTAADHFQRLFSKVQETLETAASTLNRVGGAASRDGGSWRLEDDAVRNILDTGKALRGIVAGREYIDVEATASGLMRLYARMTAAKDFHELKLPVGEKTVVVGLGAAVREELVSYVIENKSRRRQVRVSETFPTSADGTSPGVAGRLATREWTRRGPEIQIVQSIWLRVIQNLLENMSKYSVDGSAWEITLHVPTRQLRFSNDGPYDPSFDDPKELLQSARRGALVRHQRGDGLGLSIAHKAAAALAMPLTYQIVDLGHGLGRHTIELDLQRVWRHPGEGRTHDDS